MTVFLPEFDIITGENVVRAPIIKALPTGGFITVWQSDDQDGAGIRAQLLDGFGNRIGGVFQVNETIWSGDQFNPSVTVLHDGRILMSWEDRSFSGGDTTGTSIQARIFTTDGASVSGEPQFLISNPSVGNGGVSIRDQYDGKVIGLSNGSGGGHAIVYSQDIVVNNDPRYGSYSAKQAILRIFNPNGTLKSEIALATDDVRGSAVDPDASMVLLSDGNIAIAYTSRSLNGPNGSGDDVRVQVVRPDGSLIFMGQANDPAGSGGNQKQSSIAALANGGFIVVWYDENTQNIGGQAYGYSNGQLDRYGFEIPVTTTAGMQTKPVVAGLPDGRYVVA